MAILAVTIGMLLFIVPTFAKMFETSAATCRRRRKVLVCVELPQGRSLSVRVVVGRRGRSWCGSGIKHTEKGARRRRPAQAQAPVFGPVPEDRADRFARNLGTMMRAGVPILQALDIVADTTGNNGARRAVRDVQESVRQGESLTGP
jgi:type IV pilus assembly protein PilC